jgi:hypothetical protein
MFVRFRQSASRLQLSIVETRRVDGKVRHEHIASLGSVAMPITVADRINFWVKLHERLGRLTNRIDPKTLRCIYDAVNARVPLVTVEEQQALQLENAEADARFWAQLQSMHEAGIEDKRGLIASTEHEIAADETAKANAVSNAEAARTRIERIKKGESVAGGFARPMSVTEILTKAGFSASHIRHLLRVGTLSRCGADEEYYKQVRSLWGRSIRRQERGEKAVSLAIVKRLWTEGKLG